MSAPHDARITPLELPLYSPGDLWLDSFERKWNGLFVRGFAYNPNYVPLPGMTDYLVILYMKGCTKMSRSIDGVTRVVDIKPGDISLLTRAEWSEWEWSDKIECLHFYLTDKFVRSSVEMSFDQCIERIAMHDVLQVRDETVAEIGRKLIAEAKGDALGSRLYAEGLGQQLCIHLLRHYFNCKPKEITWTGTFNSAQSRRLKEFIKDHLHEDLSLHDLAYLVGLSECHFARRFRNSFGTSPHRYLLDRRLETAREMLKAPFSTIAAVAAETGFCDQSHLARCFKNRYHMTPHEWRKGSAP
jgi:AraC family transcriptional regulator